MAEGLEDAGGVIGSGGLAGEFFAADEEGVEGVGAVGAVFKQVLLRFGEFLASLVFAEAIAPSGDSSGLYGEEEVVVVLAVEEGHKPLLSCFRCDYHECSSLIFAYLVGKWYLCRLI